MFSDASRLIILYLHRSIRQSFLSLYSLKATGHLCSQLQLCLVYRKQKQGRKVRGCLQTQADGKAENRIWEFWFLFCVTQGKTQSLVVSFLYSDYKIDTFKFFFSFKCTSTLDLMGLSHTLGIFGIDCNLLIHKNKQHHQQNKSTGAAKMAITPQDPSLQLHSPRQKPTASSMQQRCQFPSIWGLNRWPHSS